MSSDCYCTCGGEQSCHEQKSLACSPGQWQHADGFVPVMIADVAGRSCSVQRPVDIDCDGAQHVSWRGCLPGAAGIASQLPVGVVPTAVDVAVRSYGSGVNVSCIGLAEPDATCWWGCQVDCLTTALRPVVLVNIPLGVSFAPMGG